MTSFFWRILYSWIAAPLLIAASHILAMKHQNLQSGLKGRKDLWQRLKQQISVRDPDKPFIWFHVSSAGEFLQAQPVLDRCLSNGYQCAVTFMSVNGYKWVQHTKFPDNKAPIVKDYLPLDSAQNMRRLLKIFQPSIIVYIQYDLWPNLIWQAHEVGIPQYLISATIQPKSKRFTSALARSFYRALYACLTGIFTVTENDRQRFLSTNPNHPDIQVVGNTRFDSVLDRKKKVVPPKLPDYIKDKFVFIAGSSWPPDEQCIFPALKRALQRYPELLIVLAPHEPTEAHLEHGETFFQEFPCERLTSLQKATTQEPRILLVDTIGVLSSLYSVGTLAYVGGAFTSGVHNVMEPSVMGLPVIFGPKHYNSPEAVDLLQQELAFTISSSEEFHQQLFKFLADPQKCRQIGQKAQQVIESQAGVADRCFELITAKIRNE